ncbi:MAG: DUF6263 family protein [Ferruginibacter sp.]
MKKGILIISIFLSATSYAQKKQSASKSILLSKGQQITITTTSTQNAEMSMGMSMKNTSTTVNKLTVLEAVKNDYKISSTLTKMTFSADMMGQQKYFDSDKKEDRDSETGKSFSLEIPKNGTLDKNTGIVVLEQEDSLSNDKGDNPLGGMMTSLIKNNDAVTISGAFLILPAGKKIADKWADSSSAEGMKTVNNYTIESIEKNIITIILNTTVSGSTSMEAEGSQFNVTMNSVSSGKIVVDSNTSLVKKRIANADIDSNIEMMGQSMPVTGTATTTTTYE